MADETGVDSHVKSETWANAPPQHRLHGLLLRNADSGREGVLHRRLGQREGRVRSLCESLIEKGLAWKADTIEELAEKVGLPVDAFKATIAAYNDGCANGNDPFGRTKQEVAMANRSVLLRSRRFLMS